MKRRDFLVGSGVAAALGSAAYEEASHVKVDSKDVSDDEKEVAKLAIGNFVSTFPAGSEPSIEQVAERGLLAIRAWRLLESGRVS